MPSKMVWQPSGTDALRSALASYVNPSGAWCIVLSCVRSNVRAGTTINLDMRRVANQRAFAIKLWNAARYVMMNVQLVGPVTPLPVDASLVLPELRLLGVAERWLLSRMGATVAAYEREMTAFNLGAALDVVSLCAGLLACVI